MYIERLPYKSQRKITSKCRIGETYFTSISFIEGKLSSNHPKNMNFVQKDTKELVYVLITVGTIISGGEAVFFDRVKTYDLGNITHSLKHSYGRMIFGLLIVSSIRLSLKSTQSSNIFYSYKKNICVFLLPLVLVL